MKGLDDAKELNILTSLPKLVVPAIAAPPATIKAPVVVFVDAVLAQACKTPPYTRPPGYKPTPSPPPLFCTSIAGNASELKPLATIPAAFAL